MGLVNVGAIMPDGAEGKAQVWAMVQIRATTFLALHGAARCCLVLYDATEK